MTMKTKMKEMELVTTTITMTGVTFYVQHNRPRGTKQMVKYTNLFSWTAQYSTIYSLGYIYDVRECTIRWWRGSTSRAIATVINVLHSSQYCPYCVFDVFHASQKMPPLCSVGYIFCMPRPYTQVLPVPDSGVNFCKLFIHTGTRQFCNIRAKCLPSPGGCGYTLVEIPGSG